MNILDVYNGLRQQLLPIGLNIYKEIKPTSEKGNCIVLNSVPIKKDNVQSIVDVKVEVPKKIIKKNRYKKD